MLGGELALAGVAAAMSCPSTGPDPLRLGRLLTPDGVHPIHRRRRSLAATATVRRL